MRALAGNLLVRNARVPDPRTGVRVAGGRVVDGVAADVRIVDGRIDAVAPSLEREIGEEVFDAGGRSTIPGLHDHHLHLRSLAAAGRSVAVGPDDVDGASGMALALQRATPDANGWRRAVGYHESVAGDLDRNALDAMVPSAPVRVQHRSGVMWVLSSPALESLGVAELRDPGVERDERGRPTGRLFRLDAWLADRLPSASDPADVTDASARLAALGVTGVTETTPGATEEDLADVVAAIDDGRLLQRMHLMCPAEVPVPNHPLVTRGPQKFLLDDDRLPPLDDLAGSIARAHAVGTPVAVHCVTAMQLVFAMTAIEAAAPLRGDRIEHAAIVPFDMLPRLAAAGITAVVNPGLLFERGDTYLADVGQDELPDLLRSSSLVGAGIALAAGTDAPFGDCDLWRAIATAHRRVTRRGVALGPDEALDESSALALFIGHPGEPARPRHIAVGEPGDLCVLDGDALPQPAGTGRAVSATIVRGHVVSQGD